MDQPVAPSEGPPPGTSEDPPRRIPVTPFSPPPETALKPNPFSFTSFGNDVPAISITSEGTRNGSLTLSSGGNRIDLPEFVDVASDDSLPSARFRGDFAFREDAVVGNGETTAVTKNYMEMLPGRPPFTEEPSGVVLRNPSGLTAPGRPPVTYERMHSGRLPVQQMDEDTLDALPVKRRYRWRDMFLTVWAMGTYIIDFITDWWVAVRFYKDDDYVWFGLTVAFIVVPHLCMTFFSLAWYIQDHRNHPTSKFISWKVWLIRFMVLSLQFAPVLRYFDSLRFGFRFRNSQPASRLELYESLCFENADAAMLRLFEAFMEAAPQLVLQIYILVRKRVAADQYDFVQSIQIVSIFFSWFSLATAMATFHRAQRFSQQVKGSMSLLGTLMQFGWHLFIFASRVIAIALFTVRFGFWGPVICGCHVIIMFMWILWMRTDFCPNRCLEVLYNIAVGCLYLFTFMNVKDTPTRWKYVFYYALYYVENVVMISLWFTHTDEILWFREPAMAAVICGFWVGVFGFMLPYYRFLHPDKGIWIAQQKKRRSRVDFDGVDTVKSKWVRGFLDFCL